MSDDLDPKVRAELRALARLINKQDEKINALSRARQLDVSSIPVTVEDDEGAQSTVDVPLNVGVSQGVHALGVANGAAERVDEAQADAAEALAEAVRAGVTADGKNTIFGPSDEAPDAPDGGFSQGDQWARSEGGNIVEMLVWDGTEWKPLTILANELIVVGDNGVVRVADGAIVAESLAVTALDGQIIRGSEFYGGKYELSDDYEWWAFFGVGANDFTLYPDAWSINNIALDTMNQLTASPTVDWNTLPPGIDHASSNSLKSGARAVQGWHGVELMIDLTSDHGEIVNVNFYTKTGRVRNIEFSAMNAANTYPTYSVTTDAHHMRDMGDGWVSHTVQLRVPRERQALGICFKTNDPDSWLYGPYVFGSRESVSGVSIDRTRVGKSYVGQMGAYQMVSLYDGQIVFSRNDDPVAPYPLPDGLRIESDFGEDHGGTTDGNDRPILRTNARTIQMRSNPDDQWSYFDALTTFHRASPAQIAAGTDNTHYVTPALLNPTVFTPTYQSPFEAWSANIPTVVSKSGRVVNVAGTARCLTANYLTSTTRRLMFTIPEAYRPHTETLAVCQGAGSERWTVMVNADGQVTAERYTGTQNANVWLPFNITFLR